MIVIMLLFVVFGCWMIFDEVFDEVCVMVICECDFYIVCDMCGCVLGCYLIV